METNLLQCRSHLMRAVNIFKLRGNSQVKK